MWLRIRQGADNLIRLFNQLQISVKITLVYAVLMAVLLTLTSACTIIGLYYTQYHQVERELTVCSQAVLRQLAQNYGYRVGYVDGRPVDLKPEEREQRQGISPRVRHDRPVNGTLQQLHGRRNGHGGQGQHQQLQTLVPIAGGVPEAAGADGQPGQSAPDSQVLTPGQPAAPQQEVVGSNGLTPQSDATNELRLETLPGVFLKITDKNNLIVYDSDVHSPALVQLQENIVEDPPIWANPKFNVVQLWTFIIYYVEEPVTIDGEQYILHLFKTITAESQMLALVQRILVVEIVGGMILALILGYFMSQKLLLPIRSLTDTAQAIEVTDMGARIQVPPTRDELARLAITFNHMLDRLQTGFRQQQRFVSDASHELRTPVTVIKGYSDMLSRWGKQDPETLQEGLTAISSEAENMQELIEKLLFLARADQKRQIINKEVVEMSQLIEDVFKKLELTATKHKVALLQNDAGKIFADKVTIRQMLRIFLENAMKYTPAGGEITLSAIRLPGYLKVEIADTGMGIAPEDQEKIFQRFYRADTSRSKGDEQPGGTGLGLSIAQWIADQHDMGISVESALGQGSKFILMMPLCDA